MTRAQLRTVIKTEARVKTGTDIDTFINDTMLEILIDYARKSHYSELLVIDTAITLVAAQQIYALPSDFMHMVELRYGVSATPTLYRTLVERNQFLQRRNSSGLPYYFFIASDGLHLYPYDTIAVTDKLYISYYRSPKTLFDSDGKEFPIPALESTVKKSTLARVARFSADLKGEASIRQDAVGSFISSQS